MERNDFLDLLQIRVQSLKNGNISDHLGSFTSQPWALACQTWPEIENSAWQRRRRALGETPYDWAKGRGQRQVMGLLRPASWQPFWSHDEDQPSWITYLTLPVWPMILSNILDTMRVERSTYMRKHYPSKVFGSSFHLLVDHQTWGLNHQIRGSTLL